MGSKNCMNDACRATTTSELKKGWSLKSGGFASLCYNCGSAYENSIFCETFHSEDTGWRACRSCGKGVHCGCIASRHLHEYMDSGGVACISCTKRMEMHSLQAMQIPSDIRNGPFVTKSVPENRIDEDRFSTERLLQLTKSIGVNKMTSPFESVLKTPESSMIKQLANSPLQPSPSSTFANSENNRNSRPKQGFKDMSESLSHPSLNFSLTATPPIARTSIMSPFPGGIAEGGEQSKDSSLHRTRHVIAKPPKPSPVSGLESSKGSSSQMRVPRPPPPEGRGRNQLLPRYWPRITDQELQKLSGDLNSTIVPLFEKILSASDAGRIGRLVLPKACAEAYFPTINQSEGIPIRIQDIKGKEWTFQFRFWPNNNSRMYVLEGVTPCIQSMQVQAGDTVIFSRRDPEGQLVIGCRKAANHVDVQEPQTPALPNSDPMENTSSSGGTDNLLVNGSRGSDDFQKQHMSLSEKKKARNIKNKRLLMHNEDALELKFTWEEAQELFRPSPSTEPTVVMVEDQEFEEFEEPPVFGKRTIFISQPSGEQEQVAQCDSCSKWRRMPVHALISANWTCAENVWDPNRSSCSAPEDINLRDPEFLKTNKEYKKQRTADGKAPREGGEPSGLDALANAAVLGDIVELTAGATTRHPRHRPGCSCIVCIQPPSGKGKHDPTCKCNVCLTVKRRFKTLMLRKKKRQSDREAELAQDEINNNANNNNNNNNNNGKEKPGEGIAVALLNINHPQNETKKNEGGDKMDITEDTNGKGRLDLNSDPRREDEILAGTSGMSLTTLMNTASGFPLDMYLGQDRASDLEPSLVSKASVGVDDNGADGGGLVAEDGKQQENKREEG